MTIAHDTVLGDKYRLIRQLDKGAMGSVWLAEHVGLRSPVAIKLTVTSSGSSNVPRLITTMSPARSC